MKAVILIAGFLLVGLRGFWYMRQLGLFLEAGNLRPRWTAEPPHMDCPRRWRPASWTGHKKGELL